jgi:hypothetical protein
MPGVPIPNMDVHSTDRESSMGRHYVKGLTGMAH